MFPPRADGTKILSLLGIILRVGEDEVDDAIITGIIAIFQLNDPHNSPLRT